MSYYKTFRLKHSGKYLWPWIKQWFPRYIPNHKQQQKKWINWISSKLQYFVLQRTLLSRNWKGKPHNEKQIVNHTHNLIRDLHLEQR